MNKIPKMDIAEFRRMGFLQEVNRQFFHPLGLALEVIVNEDGVESLGGIWDFRDDPEGMSYGKLSRAENREKAAQVFALRESKRDTRMRLYGDIIQPISEEKEQK